MLQQMERRVEATIEAWSRDWFNGELFVSVLNVLREFRLLSPERYFVSLSDMEVGFRKKHRKEDQRSFDVFFETIDEYTNPNTNEARIAELAEALRELQQ